jgi:hypothetical protein
LKTNAGTTACASIGAGAVCSAASVQTAEPSVVEAFSVVVHAGAVVPLVPAVVQR